MAKVQLGDKVKDSVTGFTGIAVARVNWLHGCDRIIIQPSGIDKEGQTFKSEHFDEPQVVVLKAKAKKEGSHGTGGPKDLGEARKQFKTIK
jgi:hypothetical protein